MRKSLVKRVALCMVAAMCVLGIVPRVDAGLVASRPLLPVDRESDLQLIQKVLELKMIGERLTELGFTTEEVRARLNDLSDRQIHQLAVNLDEIRTGGDGIGLVIGLLVIAILVVILIQLTGHKIIVK
ncbi:MAG: PA2779 family protein [Syntrophales bacterium]